MVARGERSPSDDPCQPALKGPIFRRRRLITHMTHELMTDLTSRSLPKLSLFLALAFFIINGCDFVDTQQYNPDDYTNVYMPQAQGGPAERPVPIVDSTQTIIYNAAYAGPNPPKKDIQVRFSVERALVDTFNQENVGSYEFLPEESFELSHSEATIPAGERSTGQLKISLETEGYLEVRGTTYLLPIRMEALTDDVRVNEEKQVTYFIIQGSYPEIEKSDWQVVNFSSQHPGRSDRAAVLAIDGDEDTFWHTPWCCAADEYGTSRPQPPHSITIDLGENNNVHGLEIVGRDGNYENNPKIVEVKFADEYNGENTSWREAEEFTLPFDANGQTIQTKIYLENTVDARYFKFISIESVDNDLLNLAEFYAF